MKDKKGLYVLIVTVVTILVVVLVVLTSGDKKDKNAGKGYDVKTSVADEYKYNTEIIKNDNAPSNNDAVISSIEGYTEVTDQNFISLPYEVRKDGEKVYDIISIGKCNGTFYDGAAKREFSDSLAIVIKNTSDKVVSISNVSFAYAEGKTCTFTVSNLTPGKSALIFADNYTEGKDGESPTLTSVSYADVKKINVTVDQAILTASLPMLKDKVGVDYKDGNFIITNLTGENLGQVSVKFMQCADNDANVFIGGNTCAVYQESVMPYETYIVDAKSFDPDKSTIVAVESYKVN